MNNEQSILVMEWVQTIQQYDANYRNIASQIEANQLISQLSSHHVDELKPKNDELLGLLKAMHQTLVKLEDELSRPDSDLDDKYERLKTHIKIINNLNGYVACY
ncbi:hypothetical protein GCM10028808_70450 [Spirosoma migulaei]